MAARKPEETEEQQQETAPKKGRFKPLIIVAALMLGEGVGIYVLLGIVNPPPETAMADDTPEEVDPFKVESEIFICQAQATNGKEGRVHTYHIELSAIVNCENLEMVERFVEAREKSILDRVQTVIRSADPQDLGDPTLQVMKRQLKFELNNLLGKELIEDILISNMIRSRSHL